MAIEILRRAFGAGGAAATRQTGLIARYYYFFGALAALAYLFVVSASQVISNAQLIYGIFDESYIAPALALAATPEAKQMPQVPVQPRNVRVLKTGPISNIVENVAFAHEVRKALLAWEIREGKPYTEHLIMKPYVGGFSLYYLNADNFGDIDLLKSIEGTPPRSGVCVGSGQDTYNTRCPNNPGLYGGDYLRNDLRLYLTKIRKWDRYSEASETEVTTENWRELCMIENWNIFERNIERKRAQYPELWAAVLKTHSPDSADKYSNDDRKAAAEAWGKTPRLLQTIKEKKAYYKRCGPFLDWNFARNEAKRKGEPMPPFPASVGWWFYPVYPFSIELDAVRFVAQSGIVLVLMLYALMWPVYGFIRKPSFFPQTRTLIFLAGVFAVLYIGSFLLAEETASLLSFAVFYAFVPPFLMLTVPTAWLVVKEYVKEHPVYRDFWGISRGGGARWGGIYSFIKHDFSSFMTSNKASPHPVDCGYEAPIYLGRTSIEQDPRLGLRDIGLDTDSMMLTIAGMGGGKSRDVLHNNLLTWPYGAFVLDPKGEHIQRTGARRERNSSVYVLDPFGITGEQTSHYNPLIDIDPAEKGARDQLAEICEACLPEKIETRDDHFRPLAQIILRGFIAHVMTVCPQEQRHLGTVFDILTKGKPNAEGFDFEGFSKVLEAMRNNKAFSDSPISAVGVLDKVSDRERGSFFSTMLKSIDWMNDPGIRTTYTKSDFKMEELKRDQVTIYLVLPSKKFLRFSPWMRVLISQALHSCVITPSSKTTLFVFDEFAQLGTFKPIKEGLVTLRSAKIKIWMLLQNLQQLKESYGNWSDFLSSCDQQFFAVHDLETMRYVSDMLGTYVESWQEGQPGASRHAEQERSLLTASGVKEYLSKDGNKQIVFSTTGRLPMKLARVPFYKNFRDDQYGTVSETQEY